MPQFLPDPDVTLDDLIEQLGAGLASRYAQVELVLIEAAARRMRKILALEQTGEEAAALAARQRALRDAELERAAALAELRRLAQQEVARIRKEGLAQQIVAVAAQAGQAAAAAQLAGVRGRAPRAIGTTATNAVASLTLDLESKLDVLNERITRIPDDVYKQVMSQYSPRVLLGAQTTRIAQAAAVQDFLSQGIGHVDYLRKDGSVHMRMPIGSYAEMVARTSSQRAWEDATIYRLQQSGVNLGTIAGGADACAKCAPWIGAVVSFDGTSGTVTVPSAVDGTMVTVDVKGSIGDARAAGWGHPNCRDRVVMYSPGLSNPQTVEHDPAAEKERAEQRRLEREIRSAKRDEAAAMNDTDRKRAEQAVRNAQGNMRDFIKQTGRHRQSYREQLGFADGLGGPRPEYSARPPKVPPTVQFRAGKGTPVGDAARHAVAQIRSVHTIPQTVEPVSISRMSELQMRFSPTTLGRYTRADSALILRPDAEVEFTAVHELGHWLDNKLFGNDRMYGSDQVTNDAWRRWQAAVFESRSSQALRNVLALSSDPRITPELTATAEYLLDPREQFARSYAQWIATRAADQTLLDQLRTYTTATHPVLRAYHWADDDFEAIGSALDDIFRERGLLK
ncbi:phage minor capsid protein [Microbacterium sp. 22195]|uniref:phage minor capsid protein n=1 Tax=Microbacterium sp. 22195 TaxID=3453891 RepID=UPI003F8243D6